MEKIKRILVNYHKKTISLSELENVMRPYVSSYEEFSNRIILLEQNNILVEVKAKGRTTRIPSLALQYRIDKNILKDAHFTVLQQARRQLHPSINLDFYYSKDSTVWINDQPYIEKINDYISHHGHPKTYVPSPERSLELVGNEKWISELGGKEVLERIGLFSKMKIIPFSEPLMLAINPSYIRNKSQAHLIVENKTTYQALLTALIETSFSTLIFGSGKSVIKSIEQFPMQYPVNANHYFFYFGDIDREGTLIWHLLEAKQPTILAMPFYRACLAKDPLSGKESQKLNEEALSSFLQSFLAEEQFKIDELLRDGMYYPQERLKSEELQDIWREFQWKNWI